MNEFERLVIEIQQKKEDLSKTKKEIEDLEMDLKAYMKKRQTTELKAKQSNLTILYRAVISQRFDKKLFIDEHGQNVYNQYLKPSQSMRLNYCKSK